MITISRILVPTDLSEASAPALAYGVEMARQFNARLHLLHVPEHPAEGQEAEFPIGIFEEMHSAAHDILRNLLSEADARAMRPECAMRLGKPADEIVRYASEHAVDLIVMGTHGRHGLAHLLIGSVAEAVVQRAPCPVVTVRAHTPAPVARPAAAATVIV